MFFVGIDIHLGPCSTDVCPPYYCGPQTLYFRRKSHVSHSFHWGKGYSLCNKLSGGIVKAVEGGDGDMVESKDGMAVRMLLMLGFR